ncbi:inositol monophosphatase family protein [Phytomonospora endophytica]|uniref:Histidinol-phosphatase n=1 Tax=Phytomonospora endophytica TaxID=714109 RepID=A0A841FYQ3_9ACTN|nr:inositol monophosphatase [Phytomonospora endophytica]MBB6038652.1 fructose-1,6-bisphosphatase/inositol monophosphatase family enzyme [Phytomonospora endophytica]GIG69204.1 inositol-1-monophosphatase [Phytomonospora endophytica]
MHTNAYRNIPGLQVVPMTKPATTADYLEFALSLARRAGGLIADAFNTNVQADVKSDGSPVTEVDREINRLVIDAIQERHPHHAILGEEGAVGSGKEEFKWICDPLDGTKPFLLGVPNSVFMIALMHAGNLLLAVVYDPFTKNMFHAIRGRGAYCNNDRIHVSEQRLDEGYVVLGTDSYPFIEGILNAGGRVEPVSGSGYKSMMIAKGSAVATIRQQADFHDVAPSALIVEEAGGKVTGLDGSRLVLDRAIGGAIISNGVAHAELVELAQMI